MTPTKLAASLAALALSLAGAGVWLAADEAVDVEYSYEADGGRGHGLARCAAKAGDAGLDCGDLPPSAHIHADTASAKYTTLDKPGKADQRKSACACGPKLKPNQCRVRLAEGGLRESVPGEFLAAGSWEGACVIRPCFELAEITSESGPGYSMPAECKP